MDRPRALVAMNPQTYWDLFTAERRARLHRLVDLDSSPVVLDFGASDVLERLIGTEVLITGWGAPPVDRAVLARARRLRAVVHTAGTVKPYLTREVWHRGIQVTSCAAANAVPVAEYTVAAILLAGKRAFRIRNEFARTGRPRRAGWPWLGNYGRTVGVVGASRVGRRVLELLRAHEFDLQLHDPYVTAAEASRLGTRKVDLDELLSTSDIVTLHAPSTSETRHLMDERRLALLRDGTVLVNTSRGVLVDTEALTAELLTGRIDAVLDVTDPEPLPATSVLHGLDNVFLTPHIAGSLGNELTRLADMALAELNRYVRGEAFEQAISIDQLEVSA